MRWRVALWATDPCVHSRPSESGAEFLCDVGVTYVLACTPLLNKIKIACCAYPVVSKGGTPTIITYHHDHLWLRYHWVFPFFFPSFIAFSFHLSLCNSIDDVCRNPISNFLRGRRTQEVFIGVSKSVNYTRFSWSHYYYILCPATQTRENIKCNSYSSSNRNVTCETVTRFSLIVYLFIQTHFCLPLWKPETCWN